MWALTGHVAYSYDCERWRHGCGSCPYLGEYPRLGRDTTAALFRWKDAVYRRSRITVVAPSRWLERIARESPLLGRFPVRRIPNGLDLETFRPRPRREARRALGLDPERPVVLFSSLERNDRRKGGDVLAGALSSLGDLDFQLAVLGPRGDRLRAGRCRARDRARGRAPRARVRGGGRLRPAGARGEPAERGGRVDRVRDAGRRVRPSAGFPTPFGDGETGLLVPPGDAAALAGAIRRVLGDDELRARLAAGAPRASRRQSSRPSARRANSRRSTRSCSPFEGVRSLRRRTTRRRSSRRRSCRCSRRTTRTSSTSSSTTARPTGASRSSRRYADRLHWRTASRGERGSGGGDQPRLRAHGRRADGVCQLG